MPRKAKNLLVTLGLAALLAGCVGTQTHSQPFASRALTADQAPVFSLKGDKAASAVSMVSHQLEPRVRIVDARPDYERLYYPGETDPQRWRDAVTVLPLESFRPDLDTQLKQQLLRNLDDALQYSSIELRILSFHVALDERERAEAEHLKAYRKWDDEREQRELEKEERRLRLEEQEENARQLNRELGLPSLNQDEEDESFGSTVFNGLINATIVSPAKARRLKRQRSEKLSVAPQTLPADLTDDKQSGWNCCLSVEVVLTDQDGQAATIPVSTTALVLKDDAFSAEQQMRQVVTSTLNEFGLHVRQATVENH